MRKVITVACVAYATATACPAQTLKPLPEGFDPWPPPNWEVVDYHTERGRATLCTTLGDFLHNVPDFSFVDSKELGIATFEDLLDAADEVIAFIDKHCRDAQSR
ncbi:MAG: hypothetical protein F4X97_11590 [Boseongicola sp. SB0662_bin_57]|nr:hypothetical protein [Boseongicola sp. SB0662_bin_57]